MYPPIYLLIYPSTYLCQEYQERDLKAPQTAGHRVSTYLSIDISIYLLIYIYLSIDISINKLERQVSIKISKELSVFRNILKNFLLLFIQDIEFTNLKL